MSTFPTNASYASYAIPDNTVQNASLLAVCWVLKVCVVGVGALQRKSNDNRASLATGPRHVGNDAEEEGQEEEEEECRLSTRQTSTVCVKALGS